MPCDAPRISQRRDHLEHAGGLGRVLRKAIASAVVESGVYWVGAPLVSPDQRWLVAQSGNEPVTLWVFPVR
jgi:hypothetical protein